MTLRIALLLSLFLLGGCNLLAVGCFGMPGWSCVTAKQPITLFSELDQAGEQPQLSNPVGTLDAGKASRVLDRRQDASGRTTHFRVQTRAGTSGWFAWDGSEFTGWTSGSCWK